MARKTKPNKFWESLENTISEAKKVIKEHNFDRLPSAEKLNELKCSSLGGAIIQYHGGFINFREKHLDEKDGQKPNGYWKSLENTIFEFKKVMEEKGFDTLPSNNKLKELGYFGLNNAIINFHGGIINFREKHLGEKDGQKPNGYWKSLDNCISEAKRLMKEHNYDRLPPTKKLNELGYGGLTTAICNYHGGFPNFREKHLGEKEPLRIKPNGYYTLENTIFESKKLMKEHGFDKLPTQIKLKELGYGGLNNAISKYHGGFTNFRELLGEELSRKPRGYYQSLENTISEAKKVMEEHGFDKFPSGNKLIEIGYVSLSDAISRYHGGFHNFREILNQEIGIKSKEEHLTELVEDYLKD
jgi:hypothetical protein